MEDNRELLENLRALAADGPQTAPDRVEHQLRAEFRKRIRRRRLGVSGLAALAAGVALLLWVREAPKPAATAMLAAAPAVADEDEGDASFFPLPQAEAFQPWKTPWWFGFNCRSLLYVRWDFRWMKSALMRCKRSYCWARMAWRAACG